MMTVWMAPDHLLFKHKRRTHLVRKAGGRNSRRGWVGGGDVGGRLSFSQESLQEEGRRITESLAVIGRVDGRRRGCRGEG